jgi:adenylate kinase
MDHHLHNTSSWGTSRYLGAIVRNVIIFTGCPGAGKGTQARLLSQKLDIPKISTGDMLRELAASGSALGLQLADQMLSGGFVGDDIVNKAVKERILRADCRTGFILDGYPRTVSQARFLQGILLPNDLLVVLGIAVTPSEIVQRITSRQTCASCGTIYNLLKSPPKRQGTCDHCTSELRQRDDDRVEVVQERLNAYFKQTGPVIDYYRNQGLYWAINGNTSVAEVSAQIGRAVAKIMPAALPTSTLNYV